MTMVVEVRSNESKDHFVCLFVCLFVCGGEGLKNHDPKRFQKNNIN